MELAAKDLLVWCLLLRGKRPYSELFSSAFFRIRTRITPNTDTFYDIYIQEVPSLSLPKQLIKNNTPLQQ